MLLHTESVTNKQHKNAKYSRVTILHYYSYLISSYQAIWLDKVHSMSADIEYNSTGTFNFLYYSTNRC